MRICKLSIRLKYLAEFRAKLQKVHFLRQFKDHNSIKEHEKQTNDFICSFTFFALTVCNMHF